MPIKKFKIKDARRIIDVYKDRRLFCFPDIMEFALIRGKSWINFEWIDGKTINNRNLPQAFYILGKLHRKFQLKGNKKQIIYTVCHGDVHKNNILKFNSKIFFIDTTFAHLGWNYTDLDYIDFYNFFDPQKYPWIIKDNGILDSYFEGLEIMLNNKEKELFKRKACIYSLKKSINNGHKNNIDVIFEIKCLRILENQLKHF